MRYRESGVDIDRANEATRRIRQAVRRTWNDRVLSDVGSFGGLFRLPEGLRDPVLVSSTDGVGTKLLVASRARRFDTVGEDLVNHCINDILVQGARPLFFLDYLAAARLEPDRVADVVGGLARACEAAGCALVGGETAEMPGVYHGDDFDLAGTIVGVVDAIVDGTRVEPGDVVLALPSNGLHTNGYSLVRRIVFDVAGLDVDDPLGDLGVTVADELLRPHRGYLHAVDALRACVDVRAMAHVTGGGVVENLPRVLPAGCGARIEEGTWDVPAIFRWLERTGGVERDEMYRVFNMGLGMLVVIAAADADRVPRRAGDLPLRRVGRIVEGEGVEIVPTPSTDEA